MDAHNLKLQLQGYAIVARVVGMQAENAHRMLTGQSVAYGEEAFEIQATALEQLAHDIG